MMSSPFAAQRFPEPMQDRFPTDRVQGLARE